AGAFTTATGGPGDWFNVRDHGAKGDGTSNDTAAVQSALDAAAQAGGGTVYFPAGTYLVLPTSTAPALTVGGNGIHLVGAGSKASMLVKGDNGILLRISGAGPDATGATHRRYCAVEDLGFNGSGRTGLVLELYYNDNTVVRDVYITSNLDTCIDGVELWDSRISNLVVESSTGTIADPRPNLWLRNASAASGWGSSQDNTNQVHLTGCRFEAFGTGAVWIAAGTGSTNNPNGIYLTDCKFETSQLLRGPHLKVDASSKHVHARDIYCYAGNFASTGDKAAQNIITWAGVASSLENVLIANGSVATVNSGLTVYAGKGATAVLRDVIGLYGTAPLGAHVYFEANADPGDYRLENTYANTGAQFSGTVPTTNAPNPPLRLVNGPVSDASFNRTPANGTLAVDTLNHRLYVRVGGVWQWSALNS
ncbi:glycosyl hydrolase family 28-related protein, partial [Kitasatospora cheerisanensis]|uniref:glycosyl hydrolase family 28-related protein n=1 Tax=Kitasatospora cheerisanensis TaxID=81942 RepID=UPI0005660BB7